MLFRSAEFDTLDGLRVVADFGGYQRHDANKKGYPVVQPNALHVDGTYYGAEGCGCSYEYRLAQTGFDFTRFDFTKAGILAFINEVTGKNYTEIEFAKMQKTKATKLLV